MSKKLLLLLLSSAFFIFNCSAQIGVGPSFVGTSPGKFGSGDIDKLEASTLIYIVRESENDRIEELQKIYTRATCLSMCNGQ